MGKTLSRFDFFLFLGLMRLNSVKGDVNALMPGISLKFLRTGVLSGNVLAMAGLLPLPDFNFFSVPLRNHIAVPPDVSALKALKSRFCQSGKCLTKVGLSNLCSHDQNGRRERPGFKFPFKLSFVPGSSMTIDASKPTNMEEFLNRLIKAVPIGSKVYSIKAWSSPGVEEADVDLGDIITTDRCVTSHYGDTKLFFKHQGIDEDSKLRPEWSDGYDNGCTGLCSE